ncbi:MAG: endonuclease/exonuclease/phosphatase family protein [Bacteroidales bacterium]|nr:endonuclease/exonuclease/phosphatase family protein [Bacteroidales bacterium]
MRRYLHIMIVAALSLLPQFAIAQSSELKVMSYNIRQGIAKDGTNSWMYRCPATLEMLEDQQPDVFGVQEALGDQIKFLEEFTKDYDCVGVGRDDGKKKGEYMSIFWNKKTVKMLKWGTFWLSETPDKPSKGWDAACYRTATWALMKDKRTGKKFYFVNTHLDHVGVEARKNGLDLIVDRIAEINPEGYPMVLTGDFNIKPTAPELKGLDAKMKSTRKVALKTDNHNTFNGWGKAKADDVIDYIYISGFSSCPEYQTVTKKYAQRTYVSDHYPIVARLIF